VEETPFEMIGCFVQHQSHIYEKSRPTIGQFGSQPYHYIVSI
jgi:hypothetical protein